MSPCTKQSASKSCFPLRPEFRDLYDHGVEDVLSEEVQIKRGVRQDCVLSSMLFNFYSEAKLLEALNGFNRGITVNGEAINNLRYEDDLQAFHDRVNTVSNS